MLTRDGEIVPIPGEKILHTSRPRVSLEITTPKELNIANPYTLKVDNGIAYITNERVRPSIPPPPLLVRKLLRAHRSPLSQVIYLPIRPSENFKSFFAPALNFTDTHVQSSWIGPWSWGGTVRPVPGGGIPMHIPRIEVKFVFRDGGHSDFQNKYEWLKERLHHAREMGLNPGSNLEPPPPYEDNAPGTSSGPAGSAPAGTSDQPQPPPPVPDEPPPDYVEAQTQAISTQYEERVRQDAERQ